MAQGAQHTRSSALLLLQPLSPAEGAQEGAGSDAGGAGL